MKTGDGLTNKVLSLEQARWRRAGRRLRLKLAEYAGRTEFNGEIARAHSVYLDELNQELIERDEDFTLERCFEWFIFDYILDSGKSLIESFIENSSSTLEEREKSLLLEWVKARASLYEVIADLSGRVVIEDMLRGGRYEVRNSLPDYELEEGSVILMRLLKVGDELEFSTNGLALPAYCKQPLFKFLNWDFKYSAKNKAVCEYSWDEYLQEKAHMINSLVVDLGMASGLPKLLTGEGHELIESRAHFRLADLSKVIELLLKSGTFRIVFQDDKKGKLSSMHMNWLGRIEHEGPVAMSGIGKLRVMGKLILTKKSMALSCVSKERLEQGKNLLANLAGGYIEHKRDVYKDFKTKLVEAMVKDTRLSVLRDRALPNAGETWMRKQGCSAESYMAKYDWATSEYAEVAKRVVKDLAARGYDQRQVEGALRLWHDFCSKERPGMRKPAVWVASVVYTMARLELDREVHQQDLAVQYEVAASSISERYRFLCKKLDLNQFDRRYSTKKPSFEGLHDVDTIESLLMQIIGNFKLDQ